MGAKGGGMAGPVGMVSPAGMAGMVGLVVGMAGMPGEGTPWRGAVEGTGGIARGICGTPVGPIAGVGEVDGIGIIPGGRPAIEGIIPGAVALAPMPGEEA